MRVLTPAAVAALSAPGLAMAALVRLDFPGNPMLLTTANRDILAPSGLYLGARGLGQIGEINDSPGEIKGLQLSLSGVTAEMLARALDDAGQVQGTLCTIRTAIFSAATYALADEPLVWAGRLDTMSIEEDGVTGTLSATAESSAVDLLRGNALTYSNADQQALYPGDRAFDYVVSQANTPVVWPDRQYFTAKGPG